MNCNSFLNPTKNSSSCAREMAGEMKRSTRTMNPKKADTKTPTICRNQNNKGTEIITIIQFYIFKGKVTPSITLLCKIKHHPNYMREILRKSPSNSPLYPPSQNMLVKKNYETIEGIQSSWFHGKMKPCIAFSNVISWRVIKAKNDPNQKCWTGENLHWLFLNTARRSFFNLPTSF